MNTGQIISGVGHVGLIAWALIGGAFQADPLPFEVTEVTAISTEDYAALMAREQAPEAVADVDTPEPPEEGQAPELRSQADAAPELDQPEVTETTPPDDAPEAAEAPPAEAEVSDEPPVMEQPSEDVAVVIPEVSLRPKPRPAPRIAPEPVAQPEPDVRIDEVDQPETTPDEQAEEPQPDTEATAQEEATTEIVTEAEEVASAAPVRSIRPRSRPARPEPQETAEPDSAPETDSGAVNDALAEALGQADTAPDRAPQGPPLTFGEKDALRVAVQRCWVVDPGARAANVVVTISFELNESGKVKEGSLRQISAAGGDEASQRAAFDSGRRAILRCQKNGYDLPVEKYDHWRVIEITFNPEKMRIR